MVYLMVSINEYVDKLRRSIDYIKTIDGFLVKLSSIAYDIEDNCSSGICDSSDIFKKLIESNELADVLSRFSCYVGEIESFIKNDPRHRVLRKYLSIITDRLKTLKCIEDRRYDTLMPSPTWLKESYSETTSVSVVEVASKKRFSHRGLYIKRFVSIENLWKILFITSVVLITISIVLIFVIKR